MSKNVVWIEDDANIIKSVVRPLEKAGFEFNIMSSMQEALDSLEAIRGSDLILLDLILPAGIEELSREHYIGLHLLRKLKEEKIEAPVIAFTVVSDSKTLEELKELGVSAVLQKPVLPSMLKEVVVRVVGD
jgi:CheY-like chemotaxis protein